MRHDPISRSPEASPIPQRPHLASPGGVIDPPSGVADEAHGDAIEREHLGSGSR